MKRGIVVANPTQIVHESRGSSPYGVVAFHPIYLRKYLLYWDEIHWATISTANIGMTPDLSTLVDENILHIYYIPVYPLLVSYSDLHTRTSIAQLSLLDDLNQTGNGIFVIGQPGPGLFLPEDERQISPGIEVKITNGLPSFTADVPIEEILKFKEERRDELLHFQNTLSEFGVNLSGTDNYERAANVGMEKLQLRLNGLHRVMNERYKGKIILSSLKTIFTSVSLSTELINALRGNPFRIDRVFSDGTTIAGIIGDILTLRKPPENFSDIAYLYWIEKAIKNN